MLISLSTAIAFTALFEYTLQQALDILYGGKYQICEEQHKEMWISAFCVGVIPVIGMLVLCYYLWALAAQVGSLCRVLKRGFAADRREGIIYRR